MSEAIKKLAKVQIELKAPKNQYNSFGKYAYRNAEDILSAAKPLCVENGLLLTISDNIIEVGGRLYVQAEAKVTDIESGDTLSTTAMAREPDDKKGMDASQVTGATSSYARKYALNGLFAIDDTKDADYAKQIKTNPNAPKCSQCGAVIKAGGGHTAIDVAQGSFNKYGRVLCIECGKAEKSKMEVTKNVE